MGKIKKVVFASLGLLVLVGGVLAGTFLIGKNQDFRERAAGVPGKTCSEIAFSDDFNSKSLDPKYWGITLKPTPNTITLSNGQLTLLLKQANKDYLVTNDGVSLKDFIKGNFQASTNFRGVFPENKKYGFTGIEVRNQSGKTGAGVALVRNGTNYQLATYQWTNNSNNIPQYNFLKTAISGTFQNVKIERRGLNISFYWQNGNQWEKLASTQDIGLVSKPLQIILGIATATPDKPAPVSGIFDNFSLNCL
ncbi:hypothetical protein A2188_01930 [Candidatus Woesebacteria bacterium RIFOXYA1_FULL_43_9]|uniref:Beta-xylosidase C-terminal Concanavalin A-like domain-containing protein n=1 Tax=Candidatus Woesebacteria bacterium RIFOXYA1_FULL_43_9 TaxID=1802534 RepID=A0A1F8CK68_9BACT|nr:MAG: hypothetical protein A2188_01930 [Candidatus Woesebacteria bacterium RIFOXYA1_FULL_43_9]